MSCYGRPLSPEDKEFRRQIRQKMTALESSFCRSIFEYRQRTIPIHVNNRCDACFNSIRAGTRTVCLDCQPSASPFYKSINLCDHPECLASTVPVSRRSDLENPHIPEHDMLRLRRVVQLSEQPELDQRAKRVLQACRDLFEHDDKHSEDEHSHAENRSSSSRPGPEVIQSHSESHKEVPRSASIVEGRQKQNGEPRGERRANTTGRGAREPLRIGPGGRRRGAPRFSVFERKSAAAAKDRPVQPSAMTRKKICSICRKDVRQPCWVCVDCYYQSVGALICDDCEQKMLLRCVNCQHLYKQPYWYYGYSDDNNSLCSKCEAQGIIPPPFVNEKQHTYVHALVRCKPLYKSPTEISTDARLATMEQRFTQLDEKVSSLDGKLSRLEDYLVKMESVLGQLVSKLHAQGSDGSA